MASRTEAQEAIGKGLVTVGGAVANKPATLVAPAEAVALSSSPRRFVSRGGLKLEATLRRCRLDVSGRVCLDAGASTGGFTDCLLQAGAATVIAVDVGYGQLHWRLRMDPRVVAMDRTNIRHLTSADLPRRPDMVTADLSFISLRKVIRPMAAVSDAMADFVLLVKPQFEAQAADVSRGGVVRDPSVWRSALEGVAATMSDAGVSPMACMASPLLGPAGNVEFFLVGKRTGEALSRLDLDPAIDEGRSLISPPADSVAYT